MKKRVQIVIRGCLVWVEKKQVGKLLQWEREKMVEDWKKNKVD